MALRTQPTSGEPVEASLAAGPEYSGPVRPLAVAVGAALLALVPAALLTGAADPLLLADPGPFVRWGVPVADLLGNLTGPATFGLLLLAAFLAPERTHTDRRATALRWAGGPPIAPRGPARAPDA